MKFALFAVGCSVLVLPGRAAQLKLRGQNATSELVADLSAPSLHGAFEKKEAEASALIADGKSTVAAPETAAAGSSTAIPPEVYYMFAIWSGLVGLSAMQHLRFLGTDNQGVDQDQLTMASASVRFLSKSDVSAALAHQSDARASAAIHDNWDLSVRVGLVITTAAALISVPSVSKWFDVMTYDRSFTAALILWNTGQSIGSTLANVKDLLVGTFIAFFFMFFITGFYPGGVTTSSPGHVWHIGVVWLVVTVLFMMFVNWPNGTRCWCLSFHVCNMMKFLSIKADDSPALFSENWQINVKGTMFGYLIITTLASGFCIMAASLPKPLLSHSAALGRMEQTKRHLGTILRTLFKIYIRDNDFDAQSQMSTLTVFMDRYIEDLGMMEADIDSSWWEHLDMGNYGNVRDMMIAHVTTSYSLYQNLMALKDCVAEDMVVEDEKEGKLIEQIRAPLLELQEAMLDLYGDVTDSTRDGLVDDEEAARLMNLCDDVKLKVKTLSEAFRKAVESLSGKKFVERHSSFSDKYHTVFIVCHIARCITELAETLAKRECHVRRSLWAVVKGSNPLNGMTGAAHVQFAQRNTLSLIICFVIGYVGAPGIIPKYTEGIVLNASLLLSTFVGSALQKNLGRVQGLVIGSVIGNVTHGLLGSFGCGSFYLVSTVLVLGLLCGISTYLGVSSPTFGYTAYLFGGFGSIYLLLGCSNSAVDGSSAYLNVVSATVCICVMAGVDSALAPSAAADARTAFSTFMCNARKSIETLVKDGSWPADVSPENMRGLLVSTKASAGEAEKAPTLFSFPFRVAMFVNLADLGESVLVNLQLLQQALSTGTPTGNALKILKSCKSFPDVLKHLHDGFVAAEIISMDTMQAKTAMEGFHVSKDLSIGIGCVKELVHKLAGEVGENLDAQAKNESGPIDEDTEASLHIALEEIAAMSGVAKNVRAVNDKSV